MATYRSKADRQASDRKIVAGAEKHITKNVVLNGESQSVKDIDSTLQAVIAAQDRCDALRMQLSTAVKEADAAEAKAKALRSALRKFVVAHFGDTSPVLADFGFPLRKLAQKTVAEKFLTVEKQLATRAARHTMGSRQRAAIHGAVAGQVATPVPPPAVEAPAPTPVPAITNGSNGAAQPVPLSLNGVGH